MPIRSILNLTSNEIFGMKMPTFLMRKLHRKFVGRPSWSMVALHQMKEVQSAATGIEQPT